MGLPVFREPAAAGPKVAAKPDVSAQSRSSIRRQRTIRYPPTRPRPISLAAYRLTPNNEGPGVRTLMEVLRGDRAPTVGFATGSEESSAELSHHRAMENGRNILRDALSYERPGRRMREVPASSRHLPPPLPPVPEPRDYSGTLSPEEADLAPEYLQPYVRSLQSPPHSSDRTDGLSSGPNASSLRLGSASLTPHFAPAYLFDGPRTDSPRSDAGQNLVHPEDAVPGNRDARTDDLPPLRRVGHRSIIDRPLNRPLRQESRRFGTMDGLGDRDRSISPEDDSWETLLTTITPDSQLPSPDSFSSAMASASSFSSNPAISGRPPPPPFSSSETPASIHICDIPTESEDSDTEAEDYGVAVTGNPSSPPVRNPYRYSANGRARGEESSRMVPGHPDRMGFQMPNREYELQQLQAILSRLDSMENVPNGPHELAVMSWSERQPEREA